MTDILDELERLHAAVPKNGNLPGGPDKWAECEPHQFEVNEDEVAWIVAFHNNWPALLAYVRAQEELEAAVCRYIRGQHNPRGPFAGVIDRDAIVASLAALDAARARLNGKSK